MKTQNTKYQIPDTGYRNGFLPLWLIVLLAISLVAGGIAALPKQESGQNSLLPEEELVGVENSLLTGEEKRGGVSDIDISGWKIYRSQIYPNEGYGFEVQHPAEWSSGETPGGIGFRIAGGSDDTITITYVSAAQRTLMGRPAPCTQNENCLAEKINFAGHNSLIEWRIDTPLARIEIPTLKDELGGELHIALRDLRLKEIFRKILSTFKFIESDPSADWKTYRNEEYGFEVKYPVGWSENYSDSFFFLQDNIGAMFIVEIPPAGYGIDNVVTSGPILVGGNPATKIVFKGGNNRDRIHVQFRDEDLREKIAIIFNAPGGYNLQIFNQILSTFRFLE
ncbi:MAG: hypothetical protein Q8Q39_04200 [bacterium]|nr:hypothetical protein [bacterium]